DSFSRLLEKPRPLYRLLNKCVLTVTKKWCRAGEIIRVMKCVWCVWYKVCMVCMVCRPVPLHFIHVLCKD
ncbi:hypothetical protein STEG23_006804, partial [Scotinomys teguina]